MKRGFTLIEMLIVIVIAAILMVITMQMGGKFVQDIQARQTKESWLSDVTIIRGQFLQSRTMGGVNFGSGTLSFSGDVMKLSSESNNTSSRIYPGMIIKGPSITITPYQLTCDVVPEDTIQLSFDRSSKTYCYTVDTPTCKLLQTPCPTKE